MLLKILSSTGPRREFDYPRSMGYSMNSIREHLGKTDKLYAFLRSTHHKTLNLYFLCRTNRVFTAYTSEKIYSVELVGAVLRQESFVRKMYNLGWTRPGFFDDRRNELALHHATARYHAYDIFLSLVEWRKGYLHLTQFFGFDQLLTKIIFRPYTGHRSCLAHAPAIPEQI